MEESSWFSPSPMQPLPLELTPMQHHHRPLNHDAAIRMHCTARLDHQAPDEWDEALLDIEAWSSSWDSTSPPLSTAVEDLSFVDSFIDTTMRELEDQDPCAAAQQDLTLTEENPWLPSPPPISDVDRGLLLVHLLLSCAEAVGCRDAHLASSTLHQIWPLADPSGDPMQRVSFFFAMGLSSRLSLLQNVGVNGPLTGGGTARRPTLTREEKAEAFHLLHRATPYVAFGFMAANDAICQAAEGKGETLHVVDLGMQTTLQWPSLIKTLSSRAEGPPAKLRITGVEACASDLEPEMQLLIADAAVMGIAVEFSAVAEAVSPSALAAERLGVRAGEVVVVNSVMELHRHVKESRGSLKAILTAIKRLRPAVVAVVEQDANHNGPFFLARFLESLHYYSAVFDSLEAGGMGRRSEGRRRIERWHYGEEIRSVVADEGGERVERHERADQWRRQMGRAGFQVVAMAGSAMSKARAMVAPAAYGCEGYTVAGEKGCLLLGWKGRSIMWASAWQVNHPSSS